MPRKAVGCRIWRCWPTGLGDKRLRAGAENPSRRGRQTRGAAKCRARLSRSESGPAGAGTENQRVQRGLAAGEPGLKILHAEVVKREAQLSAAQGCRVQHLALLANGFSGVSGCEPGLKILHAEVVKREAQLSAAQGCRVQHLALLANGFSGVSAASRD